jgi:hypothetical protein
MARCLAGRKDFLRVLMDTDCSAGESIFVWCDMNVAREMGNAVLLMKEVGRTNSGQSCAVGSTHRLLDPRSSMTWYSRGNGERYRKCVVSYQNAYVAIRGKCSRQSENVGRIAATRPYPVAWSRHFIMVVEASLG